MTRRINPDNIKDWYNPIGLKGFIMYKGYEDWVGFVQRVLCVTEDQASRKINRSILNHEETILLAKALHMTIEEYCEFFMVGVNLPSKQNK